MLVCSVSVWLTRAGLAQATPAPLYAGQQRAPSPSPTPRKTPSARARQPSTPHHTVVTVPPGAQAGQAISAVLPDGREIELHVPDGAQPGDEIEVDLDDFAATELQGDGTPHGHGFVSRANMYQHNTLEDIKRLIEENQQGFSSEIM